MPSRNRLKIYLENSYYHLYNRGVEKRDIFLDAQDYKTLLSYLKIYLSPTNSKDNTYESRKLKNFSDSIELLAYCLMPNHYHFLIKQSPSRAIAEFMQALFTKYTIYFNRKFNRVGTLFQDRYKAVLIDTEAHLIYLTKYIHRNPNSSSRPGLEVDQNISIKKSPSSAEHTINSTLNYPYSSLHNYLGRANQSWLHTDHILPIFKSTLDYKSFILENDEKNTDLPPHLYTLDT